MHTSQGNVTAWSSRGLINQVNSRRGADANSLFRCQICEGEISSTIRSHSCLFSDKCKVELPGACGKYVIVVFEVVDPIALATIAIS